MQQMRPANSWLQRLLLLTLALLLSLSSFAQGDSLKRFKRVAADCPEAIPVSIFKKAGYGPTLAPAGYGALQEIIARTRNSKTAFEKEHHTAWYLLTMQFDGEFVFEILPQDTSNDYDFLLYPCADSNTFCAQLKEGRILPVRSNIRRNDRNNKGVTGLNVSAQNELQAQGPGEQFSKSLQVKKGSQYMLVLDNVYDSGKGHTVLFHYVKDVFLSGTVVNEAGRALQADVVLADAKGNTVAQTTTGHDGTYEIKASIQENTNYSLNFLNDSSFIDTRIVNTVQLKDSLAFTNIKTVLPKLKKGNKYRLGNINFQPGSPELLPSSNPSLESLYRLMKKNKKMVIRIEGHVNAPFDPHPDSKGHQHLSEQRAQKVYTILQQKGIDPERMSTIGFAGTKMLFSNARSETEQSANRRVEINVLSIND